MARTKGPSRPPPSMAVFRILREKAQKNTIAASGTGSSKCKVSKRKTSKRNAAGKRKHGASIRGITLETIVEERDDGGHDLRRSDRSRRPSNKSRESESLSPKAENQGDRRLGREISFGSPKRTHPTREKIVSLPTGEKVVSYGLSEQSRSEEEKAMPTISVQMIADCIVDSFSKTGAVACTTDTRLDGSREAVNNKESNKHEKPLIITPGPKQPQIDVKDLIRINNLGISAALPERNEKGKELKDLIEEGVSLGAFGRLGAGHILNILEGAGLDYLSQ